MDISVQEVIIESYAMAEEHYSGVKTVLSGGKGKVCIRPPGSDIHYVSEVCP